GRPRTVAAWRDALTSIGRPAARRPGPATDRAEKVADEADDYPPTVRVRRVPGREPSRRRAVVDGPGEPAAPPRRRRRAPRPLAAALLLLAAARGAGLAAAAWYGRPLYERYFKNEWLVDPAGGGDVATIADALARARDGATVLIRPGTYAESLVLDRPLHLRAAVPDEAPVIAPAEGGGPCLLATAAGATVSGLRLRSPAPAADPDGGAAPAVACLEVAGGDLRVEASAIAGGAAGPAVLIRDGAAPVIVGSAIEESAGPGIVALAGARGLIADNRIANVAGHSLVVRSGAEPEVTNNVIEGGGVVFAEGARGTFARNRLLSARASAIEVTTGADPLVADNHIEQPGEAGIFVHDLGRGTFKGNTVVGSGVSGVVIASGGAPRLEENTIQGSGEHGVLVIDRGGGVLERNAIANSGGHGIAVGPDAGVDLIDNRLDGNSREPQLLDARAG
ncbi:MAG TPA: right-handed parallel beta-helix repeat-containing protein, partial [Geminicoccaceae bacterium]|nr:right-handed parallel beta-helix repeat-containing protein [Geminicoccaceae bacterium]